MNKTELVSAVVTRLAENDVKVTKKSMATYVDAVIDTIVDTVAAGEPVKITGFGSFETVERNEREGRNPSTGETIHIAASKAPKFRASSAFKAVVKSA